MICALSDLHMGSGRACDRFGHDEDAFLARLDRLEARYDRIVLVGDVFETQHGARFGDFAGELARCRRARPRLVARLEGPPYVWLRGNHDHVLAAEGVPGQVALDVDGVRIVFVHGDRFDRIARRLPTTSRMATWLGAFLARQGRGEFRRFLDWLDDSLSGLSPDPERCRYQAQAFDLLERVGADVLVMGHTHLPVVSRRGRRVVVNCGACLDGRLEYAHLDPATGTYEIVEE